MPPSLHPRIVNGPFEDPGLFVPFLFENRAVLFDLGENSALSSRDILKISHVFVTHTHMDHFVGFDRLVRILLGREKSLYLYGPEGFIKNVEGKLAGYSWNLVGNYSNRFVLNVTEVRADQLLTAQYPCRNRFGAGKKSVINPFFGALLEEPALSVSSVILDHSLPCLGFSINERFHVNIIKDQVAALGLEIGPWLKTFKRALFDGQQPDSEFTVEYGRDPQKKKTFRLKDLSQKIAIITPGQKVTYVTDVVGSRENFDRIVDFAKGSDHLFIEAAFLDAHREIAKEKYHLTARQAGTIAGLSGAKQFSIFHFSPRYMGQEHILHDEALKAYEATLHGQQTMRVPVA